MTNGHTIASVEDNPLASAGPGAHALPPNGSQPDAGDRIAAALQGLNQIEIGLMDRAEMLHRSGADLRPDTRLNSRDTP